MNEPYDPHLPSSNLSTSWNRPGPSSQGPPHSPVLASRSPRFPRSPRVASRSPGVAAPSPRVTSVQAQINDTVEAMRANIAKVTARQEGLDSLEARTESLAVTAQAFRRSADRVRKNLWWQDMKMRVIISITITVIITIIILSVVQALRRHHD